MMAGKNRKQKHEKLKPEIIGNCFQEKPYCNTGVSPPGSTGARATGSFGQAGFADEDHTRCCRSTIFKLDHL